MFLVQCELWIQSVVTHDLAVECIVANSNELGVVGPLGVHFRNSKVAVAPFFQNLT